MSSYSFRISGSFVVYLASTPQNVEAGCAIIPLGDSVVIFICRIIIWGISWGSCTLPQWVSNPRLNKSNAPHPDQSPALKPNPQWNSKLFDSKPFNVLQSKGHIVAAQYTKRISLSLSRLEMQCTQPRLAGWQVPYGLHLHRYRVAGKAYGVPRSSYIPAGMETEKQLHKSRCLPKTFNFAV